MKGLGPAAIRGLEEAGWEREKGTADIQPGTRVEAEGGLGCIWEVELAGLQSVG